MPPPGKDINLDSERNKVTREGPFVSSSLCHWCGESQLGVK